MPESRGMWRYFHELINHLPPPFNPALLVKEPVHFPLPEGGIEIRRLAIWKPRRFFHRLFPARVDRVRKQIKPALVHATGFSLLGGCPPSTIGVPLVSTLHDLIHERFPNELDPSGQISQAKLSLARASQAIIAVSETTRSDLLAIAPELEDRTWVVHHGCSLTCSPVSRPRLSHDPFQFLYVGQRGGYKNFSLLQQAMRMLSSSSIHLVVVGHLPSKKEHQELQALGLSNKIRFTGVVDDDTLANLYQQSAGYIFPSKYEGFGLPLLEAMAQHCPILAAQAGSLPEIAQDAALFFDPQAPGELAELMVKLTHLTSAERQAMIQKGQARLKAFSWEKTAAETAQVYARVLA